MIVMQLPRVVLDNGTGCMKLGFSGQSTPKIILPNCSAIPRKRQQSYVPPLLGDLCYGQAEYFCHRPFMNGLLIDPDLQRDLWDRALGKGYLNCVTQESTISVTEPYFTPSVIRHTVAEIFFEDFGFQGVLIVPSQTAVPYGFLPFRNPDTTEVTHKFQNENNTLSCFSGNQFLNVTPTTFNSQGFNLSDKTSLISIQPTSYLRPVNRALQPSSGYKFRKDIITTEGNNPCSLVVDCGFSSTHSIPFLEYIPLENAALRIDIGGQHLNSYLKNISCSKASHLQYNELLVQHMKEECCFVSLNYLEQLNGAFRNSKQMRNSNSNLYSNLKRDYILPDFNVKNKNLLIDFFKTHRTYTNEEKNTMSPPKSDILELNSDSFATPSEDKIAITLTNERISTPEILFSPSDFHTKECSLPELIYRSISSAPVELQPILASQIFLVGGTSNFSGFKERLWLELRKMLPQEWAINIYQHYKPENSVWLGLNQLTSDDQNFSNLNITREQFLEKGYLVPNF